MDVREIFEEHADFVWRVLVRSGVRDADLKDASQEVFLVVANKLEQLAEDVKVTTWLYGIAIRVAANQRRKVERKREDLQSEPDVLATSSAVETPESAMRRAEGRAALARLLEELTADQRIVFELFELEEMTCPAIADALGIPLGTVYSRLRAARAALTAKASAFSEVQS
jgi:RNA polymerase sigma-70 factor (ECF subfamily)